jgi:hypothetical protein
MPHPSLAVQHTQSSSGQHAATADTTPHPCPCPLLTCPPHPHPSTPQKTPSDVIPRFYFPSGAPVTEAVRLQYLQKVDQLFAPYPQGMPTDAFKDVLAQVGAAQSRQECVRQQLLQC